jgi:hypothetical protein
MYYSYWAAHLEYDPLLAQSQAEPEDYHTGRLTCGICREAIPVALTRYQKAQLLRQQACWGFQAVA